MQTSRQASTGVQDTELVASTMGAALEELGQKAGALPGLR